MANTNLTVQKISRLNLVDITYTTIAASGDTVTFLNVTKGTILSVIATGDGITVSYTLTTPANINGIEIANPAVSHVIGTGATVRYMISPFESSIFNSADNLVTVTITWTGGTPVVKVAALGVDY